MTATETIRSVRDGVITHAKVLESVPGSGWHPDDADSQVRQRRKEKPLSERPVAVQDDDRVYIVGADVATVKDALKAYLEKHTAPPTTALDAGIIRCSRRACEAGDVICLPTQDWNYVLNALLAQGVHCSSTCVPA